MSDLSPPPASPENLLREMRRVIADMQDAAKDGDEPGFHVGDTIGDWAGRLTEIASQLEEHTKAASPVSCSAIPLAGEGSASFAGIRSPGESRGKGGQLVALLNIVTEMARDPMGPTVTLSKQDLAVLISQLRPVSRGRESEQENLTRRLVQASDMVGKLARSAEETRGLQPQNKGQENAAGHDESAPVPEKPAGP